MISATISPALRLLSHFWLEEIKAEDVAIIAALPNLAKTLPTLESFDLTDLAVEYQRLFGFNLPPYESIFIDPSVMLMAPATERVQTLYRRGRWRAPQTRSGAPDHLGLELLAWADWLDAAQVELSRPLHTQHLALWLPVFALTLHRLAPPPFYAALAELTSELVLTTLPDPPLPPGIDPFPKLPPPPIYKGSDDSIEADTAEGQETTRSERAKPLRGFLKQLLTPCRAGLFLTRQDMAHIGQRIGSPGIMGDRFRMLEGLFRYARQYEVEPALLAQLTQVLEEADQTYAALALEFKAWTPYAAAWRQRVENMRMSLEELDLT